MNDMWHDQGDQSTARNESSPSQPRHQKKRPTIIEEDIGDEVEPNRAREGGTGDDAVTASVFMPTRPTAAYLVDVDVEA